MPTLLLGDKYRGQPDPAESAGAQCNFEVLHPRPASTGYLTNLGHLLQVYPVPTTHLPHKGWQERSTGVSGWTSGPLN